MRWRALSSCTRASADCEPAWRTTPVWQGDADVEELVDGRAVDLERGHPRPPRVAGELVAVLLGVEIDDRRLQPQWEVLGDDTDGEVLVGEVLGHGQDAVVVGVTGERRRERRRVLVVELHPERPALVVHRDGRGQPSVANPQVLEEAQRLAGRPSELGVVALRLEL
jgi:hypothetical protein